MPSKQFESLVAMMRARPIDPDASIERLRENFERIVPLLPTPPDVRIEKTHLGARAAEIFTPPTVRSDAILLFFHGGGYCIGSLNTHRHFTALLAKSASIRAVALDYRLAPEHPFPAALDDALAAYRSLVKRGVPPARIVLAGDSAGGGLTLATLIALRDAADEVPAAAVCLSPWTDLANTGASVLTRAAADPLLSLRELETFAPRYLGSTDPRHPLASPLYADLAGLPPLLVHVGGNEILLDDSLRLVERANAAGVDVTFRLDEEMIHVWHYFAPLIPEGQDAVDHVGEWIRGRVS
ncbi:MAG: alpha/beta hydrolase [Candidatus Hydrogenedentota bacterium]